MCEDEFGDQFIYWECHVDDVYATPETEARATWYGVSGIPDVRIDGKSQVTGASSCVSAYNNYRSRINQHLAENGGESEIGITGSYLIDGGNIIASCNFEQLDPGTFTNLRATILVYENEVDGYPHVVRDIYDESITLTGVGDNETVNATIPLDPGWFPEGLVVVAYVQTTSGVKEIYQGYDVPMLLDFTCPFDQLVRSVPNGDGVATFTATLTNVGDASDTFTLSRGDLMGSWPMEFVVCGDSNPHTDPVEVILGAAETCDIEVRVYTDGSKEVRGGSFNIYSDFSERTQISDLTVYNGSYSLFLVDDDRNHDEEMPIVNALDNMGFLYVDWDVHYDHAGATPRFNDISGFDFLIWHNSWWPQSPSPLNDSDVNNLMAYMDHGGSLFFTSQLFLNAPTGPAEFITDYLGVASYELDAGYEHMDGVGGDPIGDGLSLPLEFLYSSFAKGDDLTPGPTATVCMTAPDGSNVTVRNTMTNEYESKSVFMAVALNAVSETDPDPNNIATVLERILDWLAPAALEDVEDASASLLSSRIDGARPNPFNPRTEIVISLSASGAAGPVSLEIYDLEGRKVASLFEGQLDAGTHRLTWDGLTDKGEAVRSGVYFGSLTTKEGKHSEKLVLLK